MGTAMQRIFWPPFSHSAYLCFEQIKCRAHSMSFRQRLACPYGIKKWVDMSEILGYSVGSLASFAFGIVCFSGFLTLLWGFHVIVSFILIAVSVVLIAVSVVLILWRPDASQQVKATALCPTPHEGLLNILESCATFVR